MVSFLGPEAQLQLDSVLGNEIFPLLPQFPQVKALPEPSEICKIWEEECQNIQ